MITIKLESLGFRELACEYLQYAKTNKTDQSYARDIFSIKRLVDLFANKPISEITGRDLEIYKNRRSIEAKPATVNRELSCIKHMFTKAVQWEYLKASPFGDVKKFKEPPGRVRYLTSEEMDRLIDCCVDHLKPIVIVALNTGMRKGEILNLKWVDVDLINRLIIVKHSKNNQQRILPINDKLYATLMRLGSYEKREYVFTNRWGRRYNTITKGFKAAVRRAGIKDFRFHDLRHTFASGLVMNGVDIRTVQELLGHKTIAMTMRYSHLSGEHLRQAVESLGDTNPRHSAEWRRRVGIEPTAPLSRGIWI